MTVAERRTVAIVPALDREESIAATVQALLSIGAVSTVVVVDDGSRDSTSEVAATAGARVVRLADNGGKGAAVAAGVRAAPDADVYLLVDADVGATAGLVEQLLDPVRAGDADMTIAVLPGAGTKGGFGWVRKLAAAGIRRASGFQPRAPLSGQRAVRGPLLRSFDLADRFGLEAGLTIDAVRAGARVVEIDLAMDHRHTGRRLAGFRHRAGQGVDIARALWPRLTSTKARLALMAAVFLVAASGALWAGGRAAPASQPALSGLDKVVVFGLPGLGWDDLGTGRLPHLDAMINDGAIAATSVRTLSKVPSTTEGYATLGAGTRVAADQRGAVAYDAASRLEGGSARQALARRTGHWPTGEVAVVGAPAMLELNEGRNFAGRPGALADALHAAGKRAAVINNADFGSGPGKGPPASIRRPAAMAMMDSIGSVDGGRVGPALLERNPVAPFGYGADHRAVLAELDRALETTDVVLVDAGDLDRAAALAPQTAPAAAAETRQRALENTDRLLGEVRSGVGPDTLLMVVSVVPPAQEWRLTPTVMAGAGIRPGYLHSASTRRAGVVTITDLGPTILEAVDAPRGNDMIGQPLGYRPGPIDLDRLREMDRDAAYRETIYVPLTLAFVAVQAGCYLLAGLALGRLGGASRFRRPLRLAVLAFSAFPLATFVYRAIPDVAVLGASGFAVLVAIDAAIVAVASRARRHPLSPLSWILAATVALLCLDVATGARLQTSSFLGYSLHTAARFTGLGNTAFAVLAATTVLLGAIHVHYARRVGEAVVAAGLLFAFVILIDGAPTLGSDVGGILTLVPVFGLTLLALAGHRLNLRKVAVAGLITLVVVGVAAGVDLLRPAGDRTHLGNLVANVVDHGLGPFSSTVSRKLAVNLRTYRSPWAWGALVVALYVLHLVGWARSWRETLPARTALRAGVAGALAAGVLGYAVNDSGLVVTALVLVYIGPFLTLVALLGEQGGHLRLRPGYGPRPSAPVPVSGAE